MRNMLLLLTASFLLSGCSSVSKKTFGELKIGMDKEQVGNVLGKFSRPSEVSRSSSGNGKINYSYGESGYVWYDKDGLLEGYGVFGDLDDTGIDFERVVIKRSSGYKLKEMSTRKAFVVFEPYADLKSNEGSLVYQENRENFERFFKSRGYEIVKAADLADQIIVIKLGISDPKQITEVVSNPVYRLNYTPPQQSTTNIYGASGSYLGSARTTQNSYGTYTNQYAGQNTQSYTRKEYLRSLEMICMDNKSKDGQREIFWSASATSEGSSDDVRLIFPYLFYGAAQVVEKSATYKDFSLAAYHTGVRALVNLPLPITVRGPSATPTKKTKAD